MDRWQGRSALRSCLSAVLVGIAVAVPLGPATWFCLVVAMAPVSERHW